MKKILLGIIMFCVPAIVLAHTEISSTTVKRQIVPMPVVKKYEQNQSSKNLLVLKKGVKNPSVGLLQGFLIKEGYYDGSIDSFFGPKTEQAVIQFQRNFDLPADGIVGKRTTDKIQEISSGAGIATKTEDYASGGGLATNRIKLPTTPFGVLSNALTLPDLVKDSSVGVIDRKTTSKPKTGTTTFNQIGVYTVAGSGLLNSTESDSGLIKNYSDGTSGKANSEYVCGVNDTTGIRECYLLTKDEAQEIRNGTKDLSEVLANRASGQGQIGNCPSFYVDANGNPGITDQNWVENTNACGNKGSNTNNLALTVGDEVCLEGLVISIKNGKATGALCPNGLVQSAYEEDTNKYLGVIKMQETESGLVKEVQKALVALKYNVSADGVFGTKTKNEISKFQEQNNLTPDGIIGRSTLEVLQKELDKTTNNFNLLGNVLKIRNDIYEKENKNFIKNAQKQISLNSSKSWGNLVIDQSDSKWYLRSFQNDSRGKPRAFFIHTHAMPESSTAVNDQTNTNLSKNVFKILSQVQLNQVAQVSSALELDPSDGGTGTVVEQGKVFCKRITATTFAPNMYTIRGYIGTDKIFWVKDSTPTLKYQIPGNSGPFPSLKLLSGSAKNALYFSYTTNSADNIPLAAYPSQSANTNSNILFEVLNTSKIYTLKPDGKSYIAFDWSKLNDPSLPVCDMPSYGDGFIGVIGPDGTVGGYNPATGNTGIGLIPECTDGIDNDGNGKKDYPEDPGCFAQLDPYEKSANPPVTGGGVPTPTNDGTCTDGIKNGNEDTVDTGGSCAGGILSPGTNHQQPVIDHVYGAGKPVLVSWKNVNAPAALDQYLIQAKNDWNLSRKIKISIGGPGYEVPLYYGDNYTESDGSPAQWIGALSYYVSGGHQSNSRVDLNKKKIEELDLDKPEYWQFLYCHEFGHSIGMGHADVFNYNMNLGTCSDYSRAPGGGTHSFPGHSNVNYGQLNNLHPSLIDINAINALYQHNH